MPSVKTVRSAKFVRNLYGSVGAVISGKKVDTHGIGRVFWSTITYELFKRIHEAYVVKSEGGTDSLGNVFAPLAKSTIAQRPIGRGELTQFGLTKKASGTSFKNRQRGLLSPEENAEWKAKYSKVLSQLMMKMGLTTAKRIAAGSAWKHVKEMGARTKIETLGNRNVLIMRVTDTIIKSLEPSNNSGSYRPRKNQLVEQAEGKLIMGTTVPYAHFHNNTRPVIPDNIQPWVDEAVDIGFTAVFKHIQEKVL